jgi:7-cyano-7-deazaguanine synthase in queuosine biosynthesis
MVDHRAFAASCLKPCDQLDIELLRLAGLVAFADRAFRRRHSQRWSRNIEVTMPVSDPDRWSAPNITRALRDALGFVTGDVWSFNWTKCGREPVQLELGTRSGSRVTRPSTVALYSGGLDSFILRHDLAVAGDETLLVTAQTSNLIAKATADLVVGDRHCTRDATSAALAVPVRLSTGPHAEPTFRSRTFAFVATAAVAARLVGAQRVAIAENGQGALGASLVPFGAELPYRNTHPVFTALFSRFFGALRGTALRIEHPYLWKTKGAMLRSVLEQSPSLDWTRSVSCSRDLNRHKGVTDQRPCGICGNCLLRRVAIFAAGANDNDDQYHWSLLAASVHEAAKPDAAKPSTQTDIDLAARSVMTMDAFANIRPGDRSVRLAASAISQQTGAKLDETMVNLEALRSAHASEWFAFLTTLPEASWVFRYAERVA